MIYGHVTHQAGTDRRRENEPLFLPERASDHAVFGLALLLYLERSYGDPGEASVRRDLSVLTSP